MPERSQSSDTDEHPDGDRKSDKASDKPAEDQGEHEQHRSRWPLIALGIGIVIAIIAGVIYWFMTKDQADTDDAYTDGRAVMIAPQASGYVTVLAVNDNQFVHKGDLLIEIDPRQYQAAREQAAASDIIQYEQTQYRVLSVYRDPGSGYYKALGTQMQAS